jgi:hypothetical protein
MPGENIRIMCPSLTCRRVLAVPGSSRGKNVRCKGCGATIRVPEKQAKSAGDAPPADPAAKPAAGKSAA